MHWLILSIILLAQTAAVAQPAAKGGTVKPAAASAKTFWWKQRPPARDAAELSAALNKYAGKYEKEIPADYRKALSLQSKATWNRMTQHYRLGSQKVMVLRKEADRLGAACLALDAGERAGAAKAAARTLNAANELLRFIDTTEWGEGLTSPMRNEVRKAHLEAVKGWKKAAACASGE